MEGCKRKGKKDEVGRLTQANGGVGWHGPRELPKFPRPSLR